MSFTVFVNPLVLIPQYTIHASFHLSAHKLVTFKSLIHPLITVLLFPSNFCKEEIKYLAKVNNINADVENMVRKKLTSRALDSTTALPRDERKKERQEWFRLPYLEAHTGEMYLIYSQNSTFVSPFTVLITSKNIFPILKTLSRRTKKNESV